MLNAQKSVKLCIILTDIFIGLLIIVAAALPFGVSWYAEVMHRSSSLASTIMVTCYPCAPFLGFATFALKAHTQKGSVGRFPTDKTSHDFRIICCCCLIIALITLIAGATICRFTL